MIKTLMAVALLSCLNAFAQPAQIILLRHGEEPEDPNNAHLSPRGEERARALVEVLTQRPALTNHGPIAALFATRVTKDDRGHRTGETLAPLAKKLGLPVTAIYQSKEYSLLAHRILEEPAYRGKTVIVCWTHTYLPDLAAALGAKPPPPKWKEKVYDRLQVITYAQDGASFRDVPQRLLKGDGKK
jgi:hypothetical protein